MKFLYMPMKPNFTPCKTHSVIRKLGGSIRRRASSIIKKKSCLMTMGVRGGAVGWDTGLKAGELRARFPMVSVVFFIDIKFPAALWPWGRLSLRQKWAGMFQGGQGRTRRRADRLTNLMCRLPQPPGYITACTGIILLLVYLEFN